MVTAHDNNKLIGFCGYSNEHSRKHKLRKFIYSQIEKLLWKSKDIKDKEALKQYLDNYAHMPKKIEECFDGEISILIVDSNYRGQGIGKKLLEETFENAKKNGMPHLHIFTDESCNFIFYEAMGCKKVHEEIVKNQESAKLGNAETEMMYVYEKRL